MTPPESDGVGRVGAIDRGAFDLTSDPTTMSDTSTTNCACPVCGTSEGFRVAEVGEVPVLCNVLLEDPAGARAVPRGDLCLVACPSCAHVYNSAFRPERIRYDGTYENSLHFSSTFDGYARELARSLVDRYGLRGGRVLEVGCGQGRFLQMLVGAGAEGGVGYDPSFDPERAFVDTDAVQIHPEPFPPEEPRERVDLICSRHVLEHVFEPTSFVREIRPYGSISPEAGVFAEVPNGRFMFEDLAIWDLIYEHFSYFSAHSLAELFAGTGLAVDRVYSAYSNQFLCLEGRVAGTSGADDPNGGGEDRDEFLRRLRTFEDRFDRKRTGWADRLRRFRRRGWDVVLWGAGSKAVSFVNLIDSERTVSRLVDVNPRKHGRYVAGTGHEIVAPQALAGRPADVVVIMNPVYRNEIEETLEAMGQRPRLEVAT